MVATVMSQRLAYRRLYTIGWTRLCAMVVTIALVVVFTQLSTGRAQAQTASSHDMFVDLSQLQRGHSLRSGWRFKPGDDMAWANADYSDSDWASISMPQHWPAGGYPETGQMAWYRLTLQFDMNNPAAQDRLRQLGVSLGKVMSAYEFYAGGQRVGQVGKLPPHAEANYDRELVYSIPPTAVSSEGTLVLAIRVWGGSQQSVDSWFGGFYAGDFKVGEYPQLIRAGLISTMPPLLICVLFFGFGIYHLYLYQRNRQMDSFLWFGLLTLTIALYGFMLNQWRYTLGWDFLTYEKIEFGIIYLFPALSIQLVWSLLQRPVALWLRAYQWSFVVSALVVVTIPGLEILYLTLKPWQLWSLPTLLLVLGAVFSSYRAGNGEARTLIVGVVIFALASLNDFSIDLLGVDTPRLLVYGFVAIALFMAVSVANRFNIMLAHLEEEVDQRTADLQEANELLARAASVDPLTGLLNRRGFTDAADAEVQRFFRSGRDFSIVLADVDNFKGLNDKYGHACGDHILCGLANMLTHRSRDVDRVARWGGEEFIMLLPETDAAGAVTLSESLRAAVEIKLFPFGKERLHITLTFGVATFRKGESLEACIARADAALYRGKDKGRNLVELNSDQVLTVVG